MKNAIYQVEKEKRGIVFTHLSSVTSTEEKLTDSIEAMSEGEEYVAC